MKLVCTVGEGKRQIIALIGVLILFLSQGIAEAHSGQEAAVFEHMETISPVTPGDYDLPLNPFLNPSPSTLINFGRAHKKRTHVARVCAVLPKPIVITMSKLIQPKLSVDLGPLAPVGVFIAVCLAVIEEFNVEKPKYGAPHETELLDVVRFIFGFYDKNGGLFKVQTWEMRISGSPKSKLWGFLTSWLGRTPEYGWDFCELKGQGAMVTIEHRLSKSGDKTYANLISVAPVIEEMKSKVPPMNAFDGLEDSATTAADSSAPQKPYNPEVNA